MGRRSICRIIATGIITTGIIATGIIAIGIILAIGIVCISSAGRIVAIGPQRCCNPQGAI